MCVCACVEYMYIYTYLGIISYKGHAMAWVHRAGAEVAFEDTHDALLVAGEMMMMMKKGLLGLVMVLDVGWLGCVVPVCDVRVGRGYVSFYMYMKIILCMEGYDTVVNSVRVCVCGSCGGCSSIMKKKK